MKILGVDTTGAVMSVALAEDNKIIDEISGDNTKKHLETLMPCIEELCSRNSFDVNETDVFAVSIGPGSFTGIRIGAAAVSALAQAAGKPVAQVDTLSALCRNISGDGYVCAMIDAGRSEVFARIEKCGKEIMKSRPVEIHELISEFPDEKITLVGDGSVSYKEIFAENGNVAFAPEGSICQKASSVCIRAYEMSLKGGLSTYKEINPEYLRLSQAERLKNAR